MLITEKFDSITIETLRIYTEETTARLIYVLDFIFTQKGIDVELTHDQNHSNVQLNYSNLDIRCKVQINASTLLFEDDISTTYELLKNEGIYQLNGMRDPLAIVFYLISRYEEYKPYVVDEHDRFLSHQHSLVKIGDHLLPIADILVKEIWSSLGLNYSKVQSNYVFSPSFDIDVAWAFKNRNVFRRLAARVKYKNNSERKDVLNENVKDPFDTYDQIKEVAKQTKTKIFTLLGDYGPYDKNISHKNKGLRALMNELIQITDIGIHPSYASYLKFEEVRKEKKRLEEIIGQKVESSRQHFLKLRLPKSYQVLCDIGIIHDYSMGFSDNIGFRAGTSFPFLFFDLEKNETSSLWIHPYVYMDGSFMQYLNKTPEESKKIIGELIKEVKDVGGTFSMIWHNSSINDYEDWKGWKQVYEYSLKEGLK